jgi:hypothetical protein
MSMALASTPPAVASDASLSRRNGCRNGANGGVGAVAMRSRPLPISPSVGEETMARRMTAAGAVQDASL